MVCRRWRLLEFSYFGGPSGPSRSEQVSAADDELPCPPSAHRVRAIHPAPSVERKKGPDWEFDGVLAATAAGKEWVRLATMTTAQAVLGLFHIQNRADAPCHNPHDCHRLAPAPVRVDGGPDFMFDCTGSARTKEKRPGRVPRADVVRRRLDRPGSILSLSRNDAGIEPTPVRERRIKALRNDLSPDLDAAHLDC